MPSICYFFNTNTPIKSKTMIKQLKKEQFLPISIHEAWNFFATPRNLNAITPSDLTFEFLSDTPDKMYEGLFIAYRLKPIFNIPVNWYTEITHIKEHEYFIDEQRSGPYKLWHHEHHFKQVENGTLMTDILYYDIGKGFIGNLAGALLIDAKIKSIFNYRFITLKEHFQQYISTKTHRS